jgi:hypothetical protein
VTAYVLLSVTMKNVRGAAPSGFGAAGVIVIPKLFKPTSFGA